MFWFVSYENICSRLYWFVLFVWLDYIDLCVSYCTVSRGFWRSDFLDDWPCFNLWADSLPYLDDMRRCSWDLLTAPRPASIAYLADSRPCRSACLEPLATLVLAGLPPAPILFLFFITAACSRSDSSFGLSISSNSLLILNKYGILSTLSLSITICCALP